MTSTFVSSGITVRFWHVSVQVRNDKIRLVRASFDEYAFLVLTTEHALKRIGMAGFGGLQLSVKRYVFGRFTPSSPHTHCIPYIAGVNYLPKIRQRQRTAHELSVRKFNFCHVRFEAHEQYLTSNFITYMSRRLYNLSEPSNVWESPVSILHASLRHVNEYSERECETAALLILLGIG